MEVQTVTHDSNVLDRLLNPVRDVLTPDVAQAIADLRADEATQAHLDDLAERHHEGTLSAEEFAEYQALVGGINLISVLQAKARWILTRRQPA
ncbi:MAG: hypothetical protein U0790_19950 [Isosphaeraceae bacterium]